MADDGCLVDAIIDIVRRDAVLLDIDADCTDEGDVRLEARDEVERHTAPEAVAALVDLAASEDDADLRVAREHNEDVNHVRDDRDLELHLDEELCNGEVARRDVEEDHVLLVDEFDRCLRDALLRLDIRIAVFADFDHVAVLADTDRATVRALKLALLLEGAEILADAVFRDLELLTEVAHADLAVTCQHAQDDVLTFFQKHINHSYETLAFIVCSCCTIIVLDKRKIIKPFCKKLSYLITNMEDYAGFWLFYPHEVDSSVGMLGGQALKGRRIIGIRQHKERIA